jgi:hypothetical protein
MDEIVRAALRKWPNVPHCYGWLGLDVRGQWFMRDERIQAAGAFPQVKGSRIDHPKLLDFIGRNYEHDDAGSWFFQNGPQRVYVQLEAAPWVWRLDPGGDSSRLRSHTDVAATFESAYVDEHGRLYAATDRGLGIVHTQDMHLAAQAVERGAWAPEPVRFDELPRRFGYRLDPRP